MDEKQNQNDERERLEQIDAIYRGFGIVRVFGRIGNRRYVIHHKDNSGEVFELHSFKAKYGFAFTNDARRRKEETGFYDAMVKTIVENELWKPTLEVNCA